MAGMLSRKQREEIAGKIDALWTGQSRICPMCGKNGWMIGEHLVQPVTLDGADLQLGGPGYPQVMVISTTCGYTIFMNAVILGVAPLGNQEEVSAETTEKPGA